MIIYSFHLQGFQFEFYTYDPNGGSSDVPKCVGNAFLLPVNFKAAMCKGHVNLPISGIKNIPIGDITGKGFLCFIQTHVYSNSFYSNYVFT